MSVTFDPHLRASPPRQERSAQSEPAHAAPWSREGCQRGGVSSHPVLPHEGDDAGRRAGLGEEGVLEHLAGCGPLGRVSHQHPV